MKDHKLTVRQIPFNFKEAVNQPKFDLAWLEKDHYGGRAGVLQILASSLAIEFVEQTFAFFRREFKVFDSPSGRDFLAQEMRHSAYHRVLNSRYIDDQYEKHDLVGTINRTFRPVSMVHREPAIRELIRNPNDMTLMKNVVRRLVVFETSIGLITGMMRFDMVEKMGIDAFASKAHINYLWLYHCAEELEHLHEAFTVFENMFQENPWRGSNYDHSMRDLDDIDRATLHSAYCIAKKPDWDVNLDDISTLKFYSDRKKRMSEWLTPGWELSAFDEKRRHYVKMWDEVWEPALRKHVIDPCGPCQLPKTG